MRWIVETTEGVTAGQSNTDYEEREAAVRNAEERNKRAEQLEIKTRYRVRANPA